MSGSTIIFYLLAALTLVNALLAVTTRLIFRAAIYLLFSLIGVAGIYFWLQYEFIAAVQIVVYVGGIVVLIIFSILLTSQINSKLEAPKRSHLLSGLVTAVGGVVLSAVTILKFAFRPSTAPAIGTDMRTIGLQLMGTGENGYALPFEVISILLLAALVGSIFIALKNRT